MDLYLVRYLIYRINTLNTVLAPRAHYTPRNQLTPLNPPFMVCSDTLTCVPGSVENTENVMGSTCTQKRCSLPGFLDRSFPWMYTM